MTESGFPVEPLRTARVLLEPLVADSGVVAEMLHVLADPALYLHTGGAPPTVSELNARYARQARGVSADETEVWFNWIVRAGGEAVGFVQATLVRSTGVADLAWLIGTAFERRGYATEAAGAVRDWLAARPDVRQLTAHIAPANVASAGVATRIGLTPTDTLEDDELVWELTVDETNVLRNEI